MSVPRDGEEKGLSEVERRQAARDRWIDEKVRKTVFWLDYSFETVSAALSSTLHNSTVWSRATGHDVIVFDHSEYLSVYSNTSRRSILKVWRNRDERAIDGYMIQEEDQLGAGLGRFLTFIDLMPTVEGVRWVIAHLDHKPHAHHNQDYEQVKILQERMEAFIVLRVDEWCPFLRKARQSTPLALPSEPLALPDTAEEGWTDEMKKPRNRMLIALGKQRMKPIEIAAELKKHFPSEPLGEKTVYNLLSKFRGCDASIPGGRQDRAKTGNAGK